MRTIALSRCTQRAQVILDLALAVFLGAGIRRVWASADLMWMVAPVFFHALLAVHALFYLLDQAARHSAFLYTQPPRSPCAPSYAVVRLAICGTPEGTAP
jgi:hypothetical protein